jgi:site-specific DNA-methyltransferase (adenine-specific)
VRRVQLYRGDCLDFLRQLPPGSIDAVITDPPYSSGGLYRGDRMLATDAKYTQQQHQGKRADFSGDNRDQRSWAYWCELWLRLARAATKPAGYLLVFADWRQLPTATDAVQAAGWLWRGVLAWDKTEAARAPHTGYFRTQAEFIVWATNGPCKPLPAGAGGCWPGCYRVSVRQADKFHQTGKPTDLMRQLVRCCPEGGLVLDPFMGSGTTGVAALAAGRRFVGCEVSPEYFAMARWRLGRKKALSPAG